MAIDDQSQCAEGRPRHAEGSSKDTSIRYSKYAWNPLQGSGRFPPEPGSNDVKEKEMLTAQEKARILAKIRKDSYGITLEQMKQYFIEHQHAREIGDKKMMEKIEYHLTYINFHYECGLLVTGQYDKLPEVIKNW